MADQGNGTSQFRAIHLALRGPRVAIELEAGDGWQSRAALAMFVSGQAWAGAGFAVAFSDRHGLNPAAAHLLNALDPDHVVGLTYTGTQMEAITPGWLRRAFAAEVIDQDLPGAGALLPVQTTPSQALIDAASPYLVDLDGRAVPHMSTVSANSLGSLTPTTALQPTRSIGAVLAVPPYLGGTLGLALGMRCGFAKEPALPFVESADALTPEARSSLVRYALSGASEYATRDLLEFGGGLAMSVLPEDVPTVWDSTRAGLVMVSTPRSHDHRYVVVGSTEHDFSLAMALDRLTQRACWLPLGWVEDEGLRQSVRQGLSDLMNAPGGDFGDTIYTSASLTHAQIEAAFRRVWGNPQAILNARQESHTYPWDSEVYQEARTLEVEAPFALACDDHDFDISLAVPGHQDPEGAFTFATPVPVQLPRSNALQGPTRPFWEVDVSLEGTALPRSTTLPAAALRGKRDHEWVRSSRDGLTFHSTRMGFVTSGQSLQQSTARPVLHFPSLLEWLSLRASAAQPPLTVTPSDAGRRAKVSARLFGGRDRLMTELPTLLPLFREFMPPSGRTSTTYPNGDGVRLTAGQGVLTFRAVARVLPDFDSGQLRAMLDHLNQRRILRRGLVLNCADCGQLAFHSLGDLAQENVCPRCAASNSLEQQRWRHPHDEPNWFYDLHGAVRELLNQDGDVPIVAAGYLSAKTRDYADVPELDFNAEGSKPMEIDLIALTGGKVLVGEAKSRATLGNKADRSKGVAKLLDVAKLVCADGLLLCASEDKAWSQTDISAITAAVSATTWPNGRRPSLRVLTGLADPLGVTDVTIVP